MRYFILLTVLCLLGCQSTGNFTQYDLSLPFRTSESITGKPEYLNSPFVTAGNRLYMVGHQDGSFPELGWHIKDEMGGIWNHPIKLMDGFDISIIERDQATEVLSADSFTNFPFGNKHDYHLKDLDLTIERFQYVPDDLEGMVVQYKIVNSRSEDREIILKFTGHSDLRPTWLGERTAMVDDQDEATYDTTRNSVIVKDKLNEWYLRYGAIRTSSNYKNEPNKYSGNGSSGALNYDLKIGSNSSEVLTFIIAGSYHSEGELNATFKKVKANARTNLQNKIGRYKELANRSKLTIADKRLEQAYRWLKYNCDWLVQTVPEIGTGITAGIPDYPWWFGVDSEYALKGYIRIGQSEPVYSTIKLLDSVSMAVNSNGRIIHEMSTNGAVFNKGNINETPQFASLIWDIYKWTGDKKLLDNYYPTIKLGLKWLIDEQDGNQNGFPDGPGMMEIHGLDSEMIDVASYTQKAFEDAGKMATIMDDEVSAKIYGQLAKQLADNINEKFWSEEFSSYADFIGSDEEALRLIEDATLRADTLNKPWAVEELEKTKLNILGNPSDEDRPFVLHHNWVVNTPMEMGIADSTKAIKALDVAERFVNPFGVFVTGIDRDESAGSDDGSFKGSKIFTYTGAVMTLPTAVQVIAENNYGRPDNALNYLKRITRSFSYALPGSIYEVSPDYGMMTQAWNIYGYAVPIISQFFGIDPMASEKTINITPRMPLEWNNAALENVKIGDNEISIFYSKENDRIILKVLQSNPMYKLNIYLPKGKRTQTPDKVEILNDGPDTHIISKLTDTEIIIQY